MNRFFELFDLSHRDTLEIELNYAFTYNFGFEFFC